MKSLIVIDGYNFIFNYFDNKAIINDQLEMLREKLIDDLVQYKHNSDFDITIVFDSNKSSDKSRHSSRIKGVEVIFSGKTKNADSVIEELAHSKSGYDKKFIVTSDNIQQTVIFKENIYRKSVREFCIELNSQKREVARKINELGKSQNISFSSLEKRLSQKSKEEFSKIKEKMKNNKK
ncbi:MAG: YacP-like NYN domain-containing protein [Candidatus Humimicrobiaceae bacterium]